jgi:hypothetical protein
MRQFYNNNITCELIYVVLIRYIKKKNFRGTLCTTVSNPEKSVCPIPRDKRSEADVLEVLTTISERFANFKFHILNKYFYITKEK